MWCGVVSIKLLHAYGKARELITVIPAKAGISLSSSVYVETEVPACAGTTIVFNG